MMEFRLDYASLAKKLEIQELESPAGRASPQVYGQLLAIYLLFNDLTSAKFLWKRIPEETKNDNAELSLIWSVGKALWKKDHAEVYTVIGSCPAWPNHLKNIMNLIVESTRRRAEELIIKAYSTIHINEISKLMGFTDVEVAEYISNQDWILEKESGYVVITKKLVDESRNPSKAVVENRAQLLEKMTDYIMFLENSQT